VIRHIIYIKTSTILKKMIQNSYKPFSSRNGKTILMATMTLLFCMHLSSA